MWNEALVKRARAYPTGILSIMEASGYPASVRCSVEFSEANQTVIFLSLPPFARDWRGLACLLFHSHDEHLGTQREMMIKGELTTQGDSLVFRPSGFLTGSGSKTTDVMPVSGSMMQRIRFMRLGQRRAREYLAKRGAPWPPRPWKKMLRYLDEGESALKK